MCKFLIITVSVHFQQCEQNLINVKWIKENEECDFNKTDFVVFESFDGEFFKYIDKNFKSA